MNEFWNWFSNAATKVLNAILAFLPSSPFADIEIPAEVRKIMGYVNYFVPVRAMLGIAGGWLTAIGIYYLYQMILRRIQAIK